MRFVNLIIVFILYVYFCEAQTLCTGLWTYDDFAAWPTLPCTQSCGLNQQSPVHIESYKSSANLSPLQLHGYVRDTAFSLFFDGHAVRVDVPAGYNASFIPGYTLRQFHFHCLAEEIIIDDVYHPLTLHLVHATDANPPALAVLAFLFDIGPTPNAWLKPMTDELDHIHHNSTERINITMEGFSSVFNPIQQANEDGYVNFLGSLTTPPCTEGVDWYVAFKILELSDEQWRKIYELQHFNYRPIQRTLSDVAAYVPPKAMNSCSPLFASFVLIVSLFVCLFF